MKILSPAKINLFLHVTDKRPDNYHNIITLFCCIGLYDTVYLDFNTKKTSVSCSNPNVPQNSTNLAHRAADFFFNNLHRRGSVSISINKRIPVAGGLGGGSSNAAAVLLGLNKHYGYPMSAEQLAELGLQIGADVPFFLVQKPALATGIGEKLEVLDNLPPFKVVLIYPGYAVSTHEIYKNLNLGLTKCEKKIKEFLFDKGDFNAARHMCNDLESVTVSKHPDILEAKAALLRHGAAGALMSGSGPSVFGLFFDSYTAERTQFALSQKKRWQVFLADMIV